ncbi:MAG: cytochrome c [Polyangiales bacterium]|jgi:mono/diheme cytochrome c family protein
MRAIDALMMSLGLWACSARGGQAALDYSTLEVPVDRLASDDARARGRALFQQKCALCHGVRADGQGVRRQGLSQPAANFQSKDWRANTSARDVYQVVSEGRRGTSMPAWPTLSDDEKWDLAAYLLSVSEDGP